MASDYDYIFCGWCSLNPDSVKGQMKWQQYQTKTFTDNDVDIQISHCGICGSDIHTMRSGWGPTAYPIVVGHEIIGRVVRKGGSVKHLRIGDRVGVGAQANSCGKCPACLADEENYCRKNINTFGSKYPDGTISQGGYADYVRVSSKFAIKIPDAIPSNFAAPMMCGGITVYSPLKRANVGPGKIVGVIGLGGLGHFAVLFAKAMGADKVIVISRTNNKKDDAHKLGADGFIATDEDEKWNKKNSGTIDVIVSTVSSPKMPLGGYLSLLKFKGTFIQVGAPEDRLPPFNAFALMAKNCKLEGSMIGSTREIREMLDFVAAKNIKPWIQERDMISDANQAVQDMEDGKARYRYVLVNTRQNASL